MLTSKPSLNIHVLSPESVSFHGALEYHVGLPD